MTRHKYHLSGQHPSLLQIRNSAMQQRRQRAQYRGGQPEQGTPAVCREAQLIIALRQLSMQAGLDGETFNRRQAAAPHCDRIARKRLLQTCVQMAIARGDKAGSVLPVEHRRFERLTQKSADALGHICRLPHKVFIMDRKHAVRIRGTIAMQVRHGRRPFEERFVVALPSGIDPRYRYVAPVANQMDEFRTRIQRRQFRNYGKIMRRLVPQPLFVACCQQMAIDEVDHVNERRLRQHGSLTPQFLLGHVHIGPALVPNHRLDRAFDLRLRQGAGQRKIVHQRTQKPGFGRNMQARMASQDQPQQRGARAAGADDEERGLRNHDQSTSAE